MANDKTSFLEGLAQNTAGGVIGAGMGLILQKSNDRRQIRQQQKLSDMQEAANKRMATFNMEQQMEMWKNTSYGAQKEQMIKAGLNPGLMYGMGGGGGQSTGSPGGSGISGASAPMGGNEIMGMMMNKAQIDLIKAQTANVQADTENKPKTGANIEASTQSITQGIYNSRTQEALMRAQAAATAINAENIQTQTKLIENQIELMENDVEISNATKEDKIAQIQAQATGALLHNEATKAGVNVSQAQIQKIAADILQGWKDLDIKEKNQIIQEKFLQENIDYMPIDRAIKGIDMITNLIPKRGGSVRTEVDRYDKNGNMSYERRTTTTK